MRFKKSSGKICPDGDVWIAWIDDTNYLFPDGYDSVWYSRISVYGNTKKQAKEIRKYMIDALNKAEEKQK